MKETVLLVDDEPLVLASLRNILRREPYNVLTADSPAQALQILATAPVDVVVSDERMPGISGAEFLRRVRRDHPSLVRIMLTGEDDLARAASIINDGLLYRFLSKPLQPDDLRRTLQQALQMKRLAHESELMRRAAMRQG